MLELKENLPNTEYHSSLEWYSSSQLKDAIEDIRYFYKRHVTKEIDDKESTSALDIGTYFHLAVLEPEKVEEEVAIFTGYRRGREWDEFCKKNAGKIILTDSEADKAHGLINAVKESTLASSFLVNGKPEISLFARLKIVAGEIFYPEKSLWLTPFGWQKETKIPAGGTDINLRVRADYLRDDLIVDLKSTTSNAKDEYLAKKSVYTYKYDLSAAVYIDLFYLLNEKKRDFFWIFASKDYQNCQVYRCSENLLCRGRELWKKAAIEIARHIENGWQFDEERVIQMTPFEKQAEKMEDQL